MIEKQTILTPQDVEQDERIKKLENYADMLDSRFAIPGTNIRFGIDNLIGLIPGIGDTISAAMSGWVIKEAHALGASNWLKLRMLLNIIIDWFIGLIPLIGDIFDIGWKANRRNVALLRKFFDDKTSIV